MGQAFHAQCARPARPRGRGAAQGDGLLPVPEKDEAGRETQVEPCGGGRGEGGFTPGSEGWIITQLKPGDYVAACLVVDPVTYLAHAANGMLAGFTVPAE